jgi:signal transduction histidine kinase
VRRIPIRMKLAAALAMPLFALAIVTALEVAQSTDEAEQVRSESSLAKASTGHQGLITRLQNERSWASVELVGQEATYVLDTEGYEDTRAETDAAIAAFEAELAGEEQAVRDAFQPAVEALSGLEGVRAEIDAYAGPKTLDNIDTANEIYASYSELIQPLLSANGLVVSAIDNPELRQGAAVVDLTTRQVEDQAELIRLVVVGVTLQGGAVDTAAEVTDISQARSTFEQNNRDILDIGAPYAALVDELYPEEMVGQLSEQVDKAITTGHADVPEILNLISLPPDEGYGGMRDQLATDVIARANDLSHAAEVRQRWYIVLAATTLVAALLITWLVSRSITRPLRSLTRQATAMADHRLPEAVLDILDTPLGEDVEVPEVDPVAVHTRDEVSDVAEALNTVQDTALDLAVEQAVLRRNIADSFVNLGRRNQNLLGRQLDFITELEANETIPETLSNLFRLDHLATRMRRNAESLLVLAGVEPPRKWTAPVRLTDVIRAALGEVEDYQRVTVRGVEPATIVGAAAADLAHLLSELIENALVFSPPDQTVDIRGRTRHDGYTLAVIDSGLGMPPADIEAANRRLAGEESFTIAPSKYLGHYVAGNLAARHGIIVHLDNSPGNGITATVRLPASLLTTDIPIEDQPPVRASQSAGGLPPTPDLVGAVAAGLGPGSNGAASNGAESQPAPFPPADVRGPGPVPTPPPLAARTASGLVKRSRRGMRESEAPAAPLPAGDQLASLSDAATNLTGPGAPAGPWRPGPTAPGSLPPRQPGPSDPPGPQGPGRRAPIPPPGGPGPTRTASGLTRRVRGAQLPSQEPLSLRRTAEDPPASDGAGYGHVRGLRPRGGGNGHGNGHAAGGAQHDDSSARDVYSFLTSFTAGVQRGLDEVQRHPENPEESE